MSPDKSKLTKRQFVDQIRSRERQQKKSLLFGMVWIACIFMLMALADYVKDHGQSVVFLGFDVYEILKVLCLISLFGLIVLIMILAAIPGATCPNCRKGLFGIPAQISIATGNCGYCGEKVFEEN
jgi:hypothetical protein